MAEGSSKTEDLWNPYKDLLRVVSNHLSGEIENACQSELENTLRRHKHSFLSLLQNPPKNAKSREELKKGMVEGITVRGIGHQILSRELYQEAIILSDMYDLNEFVALDLLCTAQIQMTYYPDLPRGLVAVLLYYDGRKALVSALRMLLQSRKGILWCTNIKEDAEKFITLYTNQLMDNGLFGKILDLLRSMDLSKEIEKLQQNVALGGPRHRRQITDLFNSIRQILADSIFIWSAQCGLSKNNTLHLIAYLQNLKLEEDSSGKLDNVTLYLQVALLYTIDLSILHVREDGEEVVQNLPVLAENDFMESILLELAPSKKKWACEGLQATAMMAFSICLASLRLLPQGQQLMHLVEQEDVFVNAAIDLRVFHFLTHIVMENELVFTEQFIYRRFHYLLTDFIILLYSKVKELRIKADETARTMQVYTHEGLEAPVNLPRHFEQFLLAIAKLYRKDPLELQYMLEYWCPLEEAPIQGYSYRAPPRSVSLFKFVRLAGDMVPAALFVPYLMMLSSLSGCQQAARNCFNMLKQTGGFAFNSSLSWDHFFMSLNKYYGNLRQEAPPINDTVYRHRSMYHKGITPQEVNGLHAVLTLIKTVASEDEFSRLALCEHPGWAPLNVLLGLVGCSVPIPLKASLLQTLAALSKSPETAAQMWNNLEASQILVTVPSTSSYQPRGIQTELDEIESRMEEYPLTRALLELLEVLTDSGIPRTLGAGPRKPGFDPYLTFIIDSVFLKFNSRYYKNPSERWEIAAICLKLLEKILSRYEPQSSDFPNDNKPNEFNSPPGFHLMIQFNTKSEFLNLIFFIIDEGIKLFDLHVPFPGQRYVQDCTLSCLNLIEQALNLQAKFANLLTSSSYSIILTNLNKLLLSVNPRSGHPDHCLNIARYVGHQATIPKHSHAAVKVLIQLTSSPMIHSNFVNILLSNNGVDKQIRNGFVECLDGTNTSDEVDTLTATKEAVFKLLKQCLSYNSPNFSQFLFGFDMQQNLSQTLFQLPGVLDCPRTCIHSLVSILRSAVTYELAMPKATMLESAYHMLYMLCANNKTCNPVLRFLRLNQQFFKEHLTFCFTSINKGISNLNQFSWLLKITAIELKIVSYTQQVLYLKQLTNLLVGLPLLEVSTVQDPFSLIQSPKAESTLNISLLNNAKAENFLVNMILQFDFNIEQIVAPKWDYFDNNVLETLLNNCQTNTQPKLIDVKKLHHVLIDELSTLQGNAAVGQRQAILQEIQKVLMHALNINNSRNTAASIIKFVDAWRQVTEVLTVYMPLEVLSSKEQQLLSISILDHVLQKIIKIQLLPEVSNYFSGMVLLVLQNLRRCHLREEKKRRAMPGTSSMSIAELNSGVMKNILKHLIEWIIVSEVTAQKLRINLYGALVNFLDLINLEQSNVNLNDSSYTSRLDSSKLKIQSDLRYVSVPSDILSVFGEKLVEIICHDSIGGHDVCKMLAMASFSLLINPTGNVNWIMYMSRCGFLKHIIETILNSDDELKALLEPVPDNLRPLYLYESKILLLARIATSRVGAELLLEQRALCCLSSMKVFDYHPEIAKYSQLSSDVFDDFMPTVEQRYLQIFLPTLDICNAIITSLGTDNRSAVVQILYFLLSHLDVVEMILRSGSVSLSADGLKELSSLTSVIARTATNDVTTILENNSTLQDNRAHLYRIQKLMLSLLPRFILSESNVRDLLSNAAEAISYQTTDRLTYALQIVSNLLLYSKNIVANHGIEHASVGVIFQPFLNDANFSNRHSKYNDHQPSLGTIVQGLICAVSYEHQEKITLDFLTRNLAEIPEMNSIELRDLITVPAQIFDINVIRENAVHLVSEKLKRKQQEIDHCIFLTEASLYLIWAHLDYYMLKAIPKAKNTGLLATNKSFNLNTTLASASEATWKVSTDDISNLKQGLVSIFNDSFSRQLLEVVQDCSDSDKGLVEALLRKIKRIIQFVPVK